MDTITRNHQVNLMKLKSPSRAACTLTAGIVLLVATTIFAQKLGPRKDSDGATAQLVAGMIPKFHVSRGNVDNKISERLIKRYLKVLDPQKLYLTQPDVQSLGKYRDELDEQVKAGDVSFAYNTYDLYKKRMIERIGHAQKLIDADYDFTVDEEMVTDSDILPWARTDAEMNERWRKRVKYELLNSKLAEEDLEKFKMAEARTRLHKRYQTLQRTLNETEDAEILEMYLSALTHCFDPHSNYMSPQTLKEFRIAMELSLDGIGAALRSKDGFTVVAEVVPGGAADEHGKLKAGDKIVGVAQADGEFVDIVEMKLSKVVRLIRGDRGTVVRLQVKTGATGETVVYKLTRKKIELKSAEVKGEVIDAKTRTKGRNGRIGIVNIPSFYRDFRSAQQGVDDFKSTARDLRKVMGELRDQKVDAIVIDLRFNGGGALSEALEVSGMFIDHGPVLQVKEKSGRVETHEDDGGDKFGFSGPLVVICNRLSASASEIFAGVIKDYGRGILIGDTTTHGKGTVQNVMPVSKPSLFNANPYRRGALKLTISQFYRVNGESTQKHGVHSDVVLPSILDEMDLGEQFLDNPLPFDQIARAKFTPVGMVTPAIVNGLRKNSQTRVAASDEFQKLQKRIERYQSRKSRKTVSLNEQVRRKELEEDKDPDEKKTEDDPIPSKAPIFPVNDYNDEILNVTLDYLQLLKGAKTAQN